MRRDLLDVFGRSGNAPAVAPRYHFVRVDEAWLTRAAGSRGRFASVRIGWILAEVAA
jgi:hypothetical protein